MLCRIFVRRRTEGQAFVVQFERCLELVSAVGVECVGAVRDRVVGVVGVIQSRHRDGFARRHIIAFDVFGETFRTQGGVVLYGVMIGRLFEPEREVAIEADVAQRIGMDKRVGR